MSLPIIETPRYKLDLPVSGVPISYRPFLVGEQKTLLIAQDAEDNENIAMETIRLLDACVEGCDVKTLSQSDIEVLFLNIRIKSVGETSDMQVPCKKCEELNPVIIKLDSYEVLNQNSNPNPIVKLTDDVSIRLKAPSISDISNVTKKYPNEEDETKRLFAIMNAIIQEVITSDEVLTRDDFSEEDLDKFIEQMTVDHFGMMNTFIEAQPRVIINHTFECSHCGEVNEHIIGGLENFFV